MRASQNSSGRGLVAGVLNNKYEIINHQSSEIHISGAEGLYTQTEIKKVVKAYTERALTHPKGLPDSIVITLEKIPRKPEIITLLPVSTVRCASHEEAKELINKLLSGSGITKMAIQKSLRVIKGKTVMRGAAIINSASGDRLEPDKQRGIRVSRLGITKGAEKRLSKRLAGEGLNTATVKEALMLASKVASCKGIVAELCVSDDPDYTTGYIASKKLGYLRIPNIKRHGDMHGGRVFFVAPEANIEQIITYLEKTAVIIETVT